MSKFKQLIALRASNLSVRAMRRALRLSVGAVSQYLRAMSVAGISSDEAETLPEADLGRCVFGPSRPGKPPRLVPPDCAWIHNELKRNRHVTLRLQLDEYAERYGAGAYRRRAFCDHYRRWPLRLGHSTRQRHFADEKLFVDCTGLPVSGLPSRPADA